MAQKSRSFAVRFLIFVLHVVVPDFQSSRAMLWELFRIRTRIERCIGTIKSHQAKPNHVQPSKVGNLGKARAKWTKISHCIQQYQRNSIHYCGRKIVGCQKRMRIDYSTKKRCTNWSRKYFSDRFMKNCVATTICAGFGRGCPKGHEIIKPPCQDELPASFMLGFFVECV